jgi:diguanylate cyclase (GGDEF)-like protein
LASTTIPSVDAQALFDQGTVSLSGDWSFKWGDWVAFEDIHKDKSKMQVVRLPNFLPDIVDNSSKAESGKVYGYGTYAINIKNLERVFTKPSISMRSVTDAWQAWWIDELGNVSFLGKSGKISKTEQNQQVRFKPEIIQLPDTSSQGTLVIYVSVYIYDRSGVYGEINIVENFVATKSIRSDLTVRAAVIGIGLMVVFQNFIFFLQRPKDKSLLLLAIFALVVSLRSIVSSDYFYYFIDIPNYINWIIKLEYLLIILPGVAGVHYFAQLLPAKHTATVVKFSYLILFIAIIATVVIPVQRVVTEVLFYQIPLIMFALYIFGLIMRGIYKKTENALLLLLSMSPLFLAIAHDVMATQMSHYNVFVSEYGLFLFVFFQTQIQTSRFVTALDVAQHLTNHLQQEVDIKTNELSDRNKLLQEKATFLEIQHDKIKLLSATDHLTGLFNRQTLDSYSHTAFKMALKSENNLALLMIDLDNFKMINDQYGHLVGDECLKSTAAFLQSIRLRKGDLIARYGGEEIVIILIDSPIDRAKDIAQAICDGLMQNTVKGDNEDITFTASIGVAERCHNSASSVQALLHLADTALYKAKANGKNRVEIADRANNS